MPWRVSAGASSICCFSICPASRTRAAGLVGKALLDAKAAEFGTADRDDILKQTLAVLREPTLTALFGTQARSEVDIAGSLHRPGLADRSILGRVDRLLVETDTIVIADFKMTSGFRPSQAAALQMALYREALAPLWPGRSIEALLIHTGGPTIHRLAPADLDAALARLDD